MSKGQAHKRREHTHLEVCLRLLQYALNQGPGNAPAFVLSFDNQILYHDPQRFQHGFRFAELVLDFAVTVFRLFDTK